MQELRDPDARPSPETISIKYRNSKFRIPIAALGNDGKSKEKEKKKSKSIRLQAKRDACHEEQQQEEVGRMRVMVPKNIYTYIHDIKFLLKFFFV